MTCYINTCGISLHILNKMCNSSSRMCGIVTLMQSIVWNSVLLWSGSMRSNNSPQTFGAFCYMTLKLFHAKNLTLAKILKMWYNCDRSRRGFKKQNFSNCTKYKFLVIKSHFRKGSGFLLFFQKCLYLFYSVCIVIYG